MRQIRAATMVLVVMVVMAGSSRPASAETSPGASGAGATSSTSQPGASAAAGGDKGGPTLEDLIKAQSAPSAGSQGQGGEGGAGEATVTAAAAQGGRPSILGLGASFPELELNQWRADIKKLQDLNVNYQSVGSGAGRQRFIDRVGDFSVSDIQFLPFEVPRVTRPFVYAPVSAGGLAFMYHLKDAQGRRVADVKLTPETACKIFAGQITSWDDPAIVASTGHSLKRLPITPIHRADAAGTSFVLAEYCIALAPGVWGKLINDFNQRNPRNPKNPEPSENWPVVAGRSADQSNGVADSVAAADGEGRITAVETGFAKARRTTQYPQGFPVASVRNASGVFAQPSEANVTSALRYARVRPNGTHQLVFTGAGADVYYPSSYSYIIAQTTGYDPAKGFVLASYIYYAATKGQEKANDLGYAALSPNLVSAAVDAAEKIPGAPPRPANIPRYNPALDDGSGGAAGSSVLGSGAERGSGGPGGAGNAGGLGGVDPSVNLAFGVLGATGSEHGTMVLASLIMIVAGEVVRRRSRRPLGSDPT